MITTASIQIQSLKEGVASFLKHQSTTKLPQESGLCSEFSHHSDYEAYTTMCHILHYRIYECGISPSGVYSDHRMFFTLFLNEMTAFEIEDMYWVE
jgi:hypothetical protein